MKKLSLSILVCSLGFFLTGCNTVKGVGEDIQDGGAAIEKAASDAS